MKKLLILILCFFLVGCGNTRAKENTVSFYYIPADYIHTANGSMLDYEEREVTEFQSVTQILLLYLSGPVNPKFINPFPADCRLVSFSRQDDRVNIVLSDALAQLSRIQRPVACAAPAATCISLTHASSVSIRAQNASLNGKTEIVLTKDAIQLFMQPNNFLNKP